MPEVDDRDRWKRMSRIFSRFGSLSSKLWVTRVGRRKASDKGRGEDPNSLAPFFPSKPFSLHVVKFMEPRTSEKRKSEGDYLT